MRNQCLPTWGGFIMTQKKSRKEGYDPFVLGLPPYILITRSTEIVCRDRLLQPASSSCRLRYISREKVWTLDLDGSTQNALLEEIRWNEAHERPKIHAEHTIFSPLPLPCTGPFERLLCMYSSMAVAFPKEESPKCAPGCSWGIILVNAEWTILQYSLFRSVIITDLPSASDAVASSSCGRPLYFLPCTQPKVWALGHGRRACPRPQVRCNERLLIVSAFAVKGLRKLNSQIGQVRCWFTCTIVVKRYTFRSGYRVHMIPAQQHWNLRSRMSSNNSWRHGVHVTVPGTSRTVNSRCHTSFLTSVDWARQGRAALPCLSFPDSHQIWLLITHWSLSGTHLGPKVTTSHSSLPSLSPESVLIELPQAYEEFNYTTAPDLTEVSRSQKASTYIQAKRLSLSIGSGSNLINRVVRLGNVGEGAEWEVTLAG